MTRIIVCLMMLTSLAACHAGFGVGGERRHGAATNSFESALMQSDIGNYATN